MQKELLKNQGIFNYYLFWRNGLRIFCVDQDHKKQAPKMFASPMIIIFGEFFYKDIFDLCLFGSEKYKF